MSSGNTKRLACSNCRRRRKKCDLGYPCGTCERLKLVCNVNDVDLRKKRYSASYVKSLESQVSNVEANVRNLSEKLYPDFAKTFDNMPLNEVLSTLVTVHEDQSEPNKYEQIRNLLQIEKSVNSNSNVGPLSSSLDGNSNQNKLNSSGNPNENFMVSKKKKTFVKGSLYPEGPVSYQAKSKSHSLPVSTSVSNDSPSPGSQMPRKSNSPNDSNTLLNKPLSNSRERISDLKTTIIVRSSDTKNANLINNDPNILKALSNFYKWLYPGHFIFVHRESFLYGFFNHAENNYRDSQYCSTELIYAVCAIGSRLSEDLQDLSEVYYEKCKKALLEIVFDETSVACITTVQALFCLAFYELGKGNNQLAWYFSGLAIRVGYDMGFQLDPQVWFTDDSNLKLTNSELEIRSRIYWGCYIADHFICLMLGRTSSLSVSNSTIPESDELPEVEGTEEFRFASRHVLQISLPLKNLIILSRIVQVFTSKIFIETDDTEQKVLYLTKFNSHVSNWRQSLPDFLKWSKDILKDENVSTDPTLSYFWYYYYIVRLTFNKPFIEDCLEARIVVIEIIDDLKTLFNNFKNKFGSYDKANLYQLYSCLLAIKCLKNLKEFSKESSNYVEWDWDNELSFFSNIFYQEFSQAFELPRRLQEDIEYEIEQEKQEMNQVSNINYTHDFSLSNEIDDLIKELFDIAYDNNVNGNIVPST
ncbi:hypothetical protein Kpol_1071p10 [Vanderwaltozyma polyspora DSM 70294]|uniref:Zn(2)-C6 fungal-type domain-containing protein n=1 Tax=Vanderwaltozyma polyspora (strain ATCC 22028 / DSM 70294 / BCRC 21397 / CBS 2163 / NBRC 10782 / NRRL Y-8283 / UCD 57-17) TaxID=436907 RepID=A7TRK5_VANPO|nr:uncharacterized protein Kpol_1071p10 [Vanderwaltozyma polyspora DSM 70294]EDO15103.1 hypothetical protein Kpol_1071p10 [Vanderwaltozyma polyspora DSM 70294]